MLFSPACAVHGGSALTDRQRSVVRAVEVLTANNGRAPTVSELSAHCGFKRQHDAWATLQAAYRKGAVSLGSLGARRAARVIPLIAAERKTLAPSALAAAANGRSGGSSYSTPDGAGDYIPPVAASQSLERPPCSADTLAATGARVRGGR